MAQVRVGPALIAMTRAQDRIESGVRNVVQVKGRELQRDVKSRANALGLRRTGAYINGIFLESASTDSMEVAVVSSDAPQANRLEYGYVGPDSLGRVFNHKKIPAPHWGPATEAMRPVFVQACRDAVKKAQ